MPKIKQVIIMRRDLDMSKGKMIAQAAHAVLGVMKKVLDMRYAEYSYMTEWVATGQTTICVGVDSLEELIQCYNLGLRYGFISALVTDSGLTEFNYQPTTTCLAFEPLPADEIDKITGELKLL